MWPQESLKNGFKVGRNLSGPIVKFIPEQKPPLYIQQLVIQPFLEDPQWGGGGIHHLPGQPIPFLITLIIRHPLPPNSFYNFYQLLVLLTGNQQNKNKASSIWQPFKYLKIAIMSLLLGLVSSGLHTHSSFNWFVTGYELVSQTWSFLSEN